MINDKIIFRFPRRKIAIELIERETIILKNIQQFFNINIPNPVYNGQPTLVYPYPFHGYNLITGKSGCHAQLNITDRINSLAPLATFLKKLHSIREAHALKIGAKQQVFDRTNIKNTTNTLIERVQKINQKKICKVNLECFQQEIDLALSTTLPENKCLVHGDLYCKHLMFNHSTLIGIIDWGDVGINNPAVDLSVIWSFYSNQYHQPFFEIYGEVDKETWQYARFLGLYSSFLLILYGTDVKDSLLVTEAMNSIRRINSNLLLDDGATQHVFIKN